LLQKKNAPASNHQLTSASQIEKPHRDLSTGHNNASSFNAPAQNQGFGHNLSRQQSPMPFK
jgi:hypothetical protein